MLSHEYKQTKESGVKKVHLPGFLKAVLVALGLTLVVFLLFSLLLTYTPLPESAVPFITTITVVLSVVVAGGMSAGAAGRRGYLNGALTGIGYVLVLYVLSLLITGDFLFSPYILILLAIGLFGGAFGGILGINLAAGRRR